MEGTSGAVIRDRISATAGVATQNEARKSNDFNGAGALAPSPALSGAKCGEGGSRMSLRSIRATDGYGVSIWQNKPVSLSGRVEAAFIRPEKSASLISCRFPVNRLYLQACQNLT